MLMRPGVTIFAATMMAAPMLIFLMLMQKQFVRGLTAGALKDA